MERDAAAYWRKIEPTGFPPIWLRPPNGPRQTKAELKKNSVDGLAMEWSDALVLEGKESPEDMVRAIEKVSVEDVNRVARKYLEPGQSIVTILTPESSGKPVAGATHGPGVESFTPANAKPASFPNGQKRPQASRHTRIYRQSHCHRAAQRPQAHRAARERERHGKRLRPRQKQPGHGGPERKEGVDQVLDELFLSAPRPSTGWPFRRPLTRSAPRSPPAPTLTCTS